MFLYSKFRIVLSTGILYNCTSGRVPALYIKLNIPVYIVKYCHASIFNSISLVQISVETMANSELTKLHLHAFPQTCQPNHTLQIN